MKYLGIDYGSKRIGVSVSDEQGSMAFPLSVVLNDKNIIKSIVTLIKDNNIDSIVVGKSINFKGEDNIIQKDIDIFVESLKKNCKIPVFFENEFLTSLQAEKIQGKNKMLDASSATIILQSFIDKSKL